MTVPPPVPDGVPYNSAGAAYFDGDVPLGQPVRLTVRKRPVALVISFPESDRADVIWPGHEIRRIEDEADRGSSMLRWTGDPVARLHLKSSGILHNFPALNRRAPPKGRGRLAAWAVGAVAAVALQIGVLVPMAADQLAEYVPPEGERALGEATLGQIREALDETGLQQLALCENPAGQRALGMMVERLTQGRKLVQPTEVFVLDHPMVNAFALPGGYVVFFRGLIDLAETPDEIAAVLGHEIGHVVSRDPTRHAMRSAGSIGVLGLLFGDFAGGAVVLFLANRLISAKYSQGAETGADAFAILLMKDAGITPAALGDMFDRMRKQSGDVDGLAAHFLSHPTLGNRIDRARAAVEEGVDYTPSLSEEDWQAVKRICK